MTNRNFSATRQCWSKGFGGSDAFMKLRVLGSVVNSEIGENHTGWYCQLKSKWADFLPRAVNLNAEQSMSDEFVDYLILGQIHLT